MTGRGGKGRELLQRGQFTRVIPNDVENPQPLDALVISYRPGRRIMTRRGATLAHWILALAALVADSADVLRHKPETSIFNGTDLTGWKTESTKADVREGVLHVGSGNGWVRTERAYADFVLQLDMRLEDKGEAGVLRAGVADLRQFVDSQ